MNDRSQDVRITFYEVLDHWLNNVEINSMKEFDSHFVMFLLNGVSDENHDISSKCKIMLEEHGRAMREALIALGEEEDDN
jgi:hypothetical protein